MVDLHSLAGLPILTDRYLDNGKRRVQVRFPKTKKRRVRKKWAKRPENYALRQEVEPQVFRIAGHGLLMHPDTAEAMREALVKSGSRVEVARERVERELRQPALPFDVARSRVPGGVPWLMS